MPCGCTTKADLPRGRPPPLPATDRASGPGRLPGRLPAPAHGPDGPAVLRRARCPGVGRGPRPDGRRGRRCHRAVHRRHPRVAATRPPPSTSTRPGAGWRAAALGPLGLDRPAHPARLPPEAGPGGHGRPRGDRCDDRGGRPRRLEALPPLRRRPCSLQRPPPPRARWPSASAGTRAGPTTWPASSGRGQATPSKRPSQRGTTTSMPPPCTRSGSATDSWWPRASRPTPHPRSASVGLREEGLQPARPPRRPTRRRAAVHHRLHRALRQQPGRAGHPDGEAPAEDLGILAHTRRGEELLRHPQLRLDLRKHDSNVLAGLRQLFEGQVWLPAGT